MINLTRIKSAGGAADYLSKTDDYYREGDHAPTAWHGEGAERLGLQGEVNSKDFERLLHGRLPDGTQLTQGKNHAPGHDMTLSAPKSVSIMALAGGDHRLVEAHDAAVAAAIKHIEQHSATTRIKENREIHTVATDNLTVATFRHASSREKDPQLHTHAVILNMTQDANGQWRSFESRAMYRMQKELDVVYKNELARYCREAGYELEITKDGFEIKGIDQLMKHWSSRKEQIEAELAKIGKTRETATAAERETAALNSRKDKEPQDHENLREGWRQEALQRGIDLEKQAESAKLAQSLSITPQSMDKAIEAVKMASDHLSERQSRFSAHDLEKEAMRFAGVGSASKDEIRQAIELARANGDLIDRQTYSHSTHTGQRDHIDGFTTRELVEEESAMLQFADNAIGSDTTKSVTVRYADRDIALATAALRGAEHLKENVIFQPHYIREQMKSGSREYDSSGRMFIRTTDGQVICPDLHVRVKQYESHNLNHLGLTKTKYIVTDTGTVLKQGGTLKSEFAGWINDKARQKGAGVFTKATAAFFKRDQNWRRAGAIEGGIVRNIMIHREEKAREAAQRALERQASGIRSIHKVESKAVCSKEQADKAILAQEQKTGFKFNDGQREATTGILTSKDRITLIQGYAGTAKTTSCLDAAARELQRQGYDVKALAPTNDASRVLGDAIGAEGHTVAKHLIESEKAADRDPGKKEAWIVDEASLLSTKDMNRLLREAEKANAKLVLVGDVKQLGSVERGAAFRQLQEQTQLKTYKLDEIVRQRSSELKEAVNESIRGQVKESLERIQKEGGLREMKTREERVEAIAKDYSALTREERVKTIVIAPGRDDKAEIDRAIREELKSDGTLTGEAKAVETLEKKDLTKIESRLAASYDKGDIVRDKTGEFGRIVEIDRGKNTLTVERQGGSKVLVDPAKARLDAFRETEKDIQAGDKLRVTAAIKVTNDKGKEETIRNGQKLEVVKIDGNKVECRTESGKSVTLDMSKENHRQLTHGYASTTFPAQGKTADRVLIHAESKRLNLQSQQNYYVAISRAKDAAMVYTDSKERLAKQLESHTGQKETAMRSNDERDRERLDRERKQLETKYIEAELAKGTPLPEAIKIGENKAKTQQQANKTNEQEREALKAKIAKEKAAGRDIQPILRQQVQQTTQQVQQVQQPQQQRQPELQQEAARQAQQQHSHERGGMER